MHIFNKDKKGLTLVEVVVALSIFTIVFSGTVTLIVNIVTLAMAAREKTEAVAYAQKRLAEQIKNLNYGCTITPNKLTDETNPKGYESYSSVDPVVEDSTNLGNFISPTSGNGDFLKVTSRVEWDGRLGRQEYKITQLIRNE